MHKYLRAIGFSKYTKKSDVQSMLREICRHPSLTTVFCDGEDEYGFLSRKFADGIGIRLMGEFDSRGNFMEDYYFPYTETDRISLDLPCTIERHSGENSFGGIVEDLRLGISLIFYISNGIEYVNRLKKDDGEVRLKGISLNALSNSGKILLPLQKTEKEKQRLALVLKNRGSLMEAAQQGDEKAMESLAMEDMNLFQNVSERIMQEDVYSIVDTCFMPYGLESDQYAVVGEIHRAEKIMNRMTGEACWRLYLECNDIYLTVTINEMDLLGEPAAGRRFKGDIWLQGKVIFA